MHTLARIAACLSAFALSLVFAAPAHAESAEEYLTKLDRSLNNWKTLDSEFEVTTESGSSKTLLKLRNRMQNKGAFNKQFVDIGAPADMAGTKVLTKSPEKMYIYLPSFKKVRRIASHMNEQGFLGTALASKDMNLTHYGETFTATVVSDSAKELELKLVAKDDKAPYPRLDMKVDKERMVPTQVKFFGEGNAHIKTESRSDYVCESGYCMPKTLKMVDHGKGVSSTIRLVSYKVNPALEKGLFSKRNLK
ncbi:MAG: outer membrane lipoprotein-sorting protein [Deltaproteobacteria bacterium]|nr:outer membrane lipoprotein-sorting protein [Deltaproteobacteria bacterium]